VNPAFVNIGSKTSSEVASAIIEKAIPKANTIRTMTGDAQRLDGG
jgi:hypothetical protein